MKLIVGLGNPGTEYSHTRHNIGFRIIDQLNINLNQSNTWESNKKLHSHIAKSADIILCKPQTFMNLSGEAVVAIQRLYKIETKDVWITHDEVDLEKGKIKIQIGGGSAGHNGIKSIIEKLGSPEFIRFRIGVGKPVDKVMQETADYVLEKFTQEEEKDFLPETIKKTTEAIQHALKNELLATMNKYN
jgi:PTH1 family peptidyl-tRNA hydrolase